MLLKPVRLPNVRALVLDYLSRQDGTHTAIVEATKQVESSISLVLFDLHTERLIHIGSFTQKSSRHRYVRTWRLGPGKDATMNGLETAVEQHAVAAVKALKLRDMTRVELATAMDWGVTNTYNVITHMIRHNMAHVCCKRVERKGQRAINVYRVGPGTEIKQPPAPRPKKQKRHVLPPPDPLMAALFGR